MSEPALSIVGGDKQTGTAGQPLQAPIVAQVYDAGTGSPIARAIVNWVVTAGAGSVFAPSVTSDSLGMIREIWTLGIHGPQRLEARSIDANGQPVTYAAVTATANWAPDGAGDHTVLITNAPIVPGDPAIGAFALRLVHADGSIQLSRSIAPFDTDCIAFSVAPADSIRPVIAWSSGTTSGGNLPAIYADHVPGPGGVPIMSKDWTIVAASDGGGSWSAQGPAPASACD